MTTLEQELTLPEAEEPAELAAPARSGPRRRWIVAGQVSVVLLVLLAAEWLVRSGRIMEIYLPAPTSVASAFPELVTEKNLFGNLAVTTSEFALGFALSTTLGIGVGLLIGLSRTADEFIAPFLAGLMAVPLVAIVPILTIWFGIGFSQKVVIVFLFGFFQMAYNTAAGVKATRPEHVLVARSLQASRARTIWHVVLPSATPPILAAVRLTAGTGLVGALFAEMLSSKAGLGNMLSAAVSLFRTADVFALVLFVSLWAIVVLWIVDVLERRIFLRWRNAGDA